MTPDRHASYCEGYHLDSVSCREATDIRKEEARNPWNCWAEGSSGYHRFDGDRTPNMACQYGCGRTWGELEADLKRPTE